MPVPAYEFLYPFSVQPAISPDIGHKKIRAVKQDWSADKPQEQFYVPFSEIVDSDHYPIAVEKRTEPSVSDNTGHPEHEQDGAEPDHPDKQIFGIAVHDSVSFAHPHSLHHSAPLI